jgi:hypothetical protein
MSIAATSIALCAPVFTLISLLVLMSLATTHRQDVCLLPVCYCENVTEANDFFAQPVSGWSCIPFILIGWMIAGVGSINLSTTGNNRFKTNPLYCMIYSTLVSLVGTFSMFFHATVTEWGEKMDGVSINCFVAYLLYLFATRILSGSQRFGWLAMPWLILPIGLTVLGSMIGMEFAPSSIREVTFGSLVGVLTAFEGLSIVRCWETSTSRPSRWLAFLAALVCMIVAFVCWILSRQPGDALCNPPGAGHAVWHTFTALAAGFLYLYYSSEFENQSSQAKDVDV